MNLVAFCRLKAPRLLRRGFKGCNDQEVGHAGREAGQGCINDWELILPVVPWPDGTTLHIGRDSADLSWVIPAPLRLPGVRISMMYGS